MIEVHICKHYIVMQTLITCSVRAGAAAKLSANPATFKEIMILGLPMAFDLTATLLMSVGLL
jgi:hypothetical protein